MPHHESRSTRALTIALALTAGVFLTQFVGGLYTNSLSVLSNAGHLLTDIGSMGLALYAAKIEHNEPTSLHSYGYLRSGIVAAFVNALVLAAIAIALVISGLMRLLHPVSVHATGMLWVAAIALIFNLATGIFLHEHDAHDLNRQGAFWHVVGDALSSVGIIVAALLIRTTHWLGWDPMASIFIGLVVGRAAYQVARPSLNILMEATPTGVHPDSVEASLRSHQAVEEVHHVHVWSLTPEYHALSAHVRLTNMSIREGQMVIHAMERTLKEEFNIQHVTIQIETEQHDDEDHC